MGCIGLKKENVGIELLGPAKARRRGERAGGQADWSVGLACCLLGQRKGKESRGGTIQMGRGHWPSAWALGSGIDAFQSKSDVAGVESARRARVESVNESQARKEQGLQQTHEIHKHVDHDTVQREMRGSVVMNWN